MILKQAHRYRIAFMMQLYSYYRSSSSYRVRIALNYKGLAYKHHSVHLLKNGGEQHAPEYKALNPQELVPTLIDGDFLLTQSMAILEYLEEKYPRPHILPKDLEQRAYVRQLSLVSVADIHPINNLRVLTHLSSELGVSQEQKTAWYHNWITLGFDAIEKLLDRSPFRTGPYCCGDQVTMADICLVPQVYNARRYEMSLDRWPLIQAIDHNCLKLKEFLDASPEHQPDTPEEHRAPLVKGHTANG
jgi:maleylacetoacetate isomerase